MSRPVKLRFTTLFRSLRHGVLAVVVTFLPLVIAFLMNGFSVNGLHIGGAAVWLCVTVPVAPVYFLKFARMELYNRPLIYAQSKKGGFTRYIKKPDLKKILADLKEFANPLTFIILGVVIIVLIINVTLVLHWDQY